MKARIDTGSVHTYPVPMNLTLSVEDRAVAEARKVAESMGTSLNALVRTYIESLAGQASGGDTMAELRELSARGRRGGWRFDRDEVHERP